MKHILDFLTELSRNNNRDWFMENKPRYTQIQTEIVRLAEQLIDGISSFDPSIRGLGVRDCTYRIYRDVRFSKDKQPYKTHIGIYLCPHGKKSGYAGYYFHIEPEGGEESIGAFITSGLYCPDKNDLKSVREDIVDYGTDFLKAIKKAKGFELERGNSLKKLPQGFESCQYDDLLKLKDILITKPLSVEYLCQPYLAEQLVGDFRTTFDFISMLNRAIDYAREEQNGF